MQVCCAAWWVVVSICLIIAIIGSFQKDVYTRDGFAQGILRICLLHILITAMLHLYLLTKGGSFVKLFFKQENHKLWYFGYFMFVAGIGQRISFDTKKVPILSEYLLTVSVVYISMIVFIDVLNEYFTFENNQKKIEQTRATHTNNYTQSQSTFTSNSQNSKSKNDSSNSGNSSSSCSSNKINSLFSDGNDHYNESHSDSNSNSNGNKHGGITVTTVQCINNNGNTDVKVETIEDELTQTLNPSKTNDVENTEQLSRLQVYRISLSFPIRGFLLFYIGLFISEIIVLFFLDNGYDGNIKHKKTYNNQILYWSNLFIDGGSISHRARAELVETFLLLISISIMLFLFVKSNTYHTPNQQFEQLKEQMKVEFKIQSQKHSLRPNKNTIIITNGIISAFGVLFQLLRFDDHTTGGYGYYTHWITFTVAIGSVLIEIYSLWLVPRLLEYFNDSLALWFLFKILFPIDNDNRAVVSIKFILLAFLSYLLVISDHIEQLIIYSILMFLNLLLLSYLTFSRHYNIIAYLNDQALRLKKNRNYYQNNISNMSNYYDTHTTSTKKTNLSKTSRLSRALTYVSGGLTFGGNNINISSKQSKVAPLIINENIEDNNNNNDEDDDNIPHIIRGNSDDNTKIDADGVTTRDGTIELEFGTRNENNGKYFSQSYLSCYVLTNISFYFTLIYLIVLKCNSIKDSDKKNSDSNSNESKLIGMIYIEFTCLFCAMLYHNEISNYFNNIFLNRNSLINVDLNYGMNNIIFWLIMLVLGSVCCMFHWVQYILDDGHENGEEYYAFACAQLVLTSFLFVNAFSAMLVI